MAFFRPKSPQEKAAALADELVRARYVNARGELHDAVLAAANDGGADPQWVESVMPAMARETAEAWLDVHPEPNERDLKNLWEKDLRAFWHRSYWTNFTTEIKDLAQEISVAVQNEVVRLHIARDGAKPKTKAKTKVEDNAVDATDSLLGGSLVPAWTQDPEDDADALMPDNTNDVEDEEAPVVGVARAIEVWRWANAEKLTESARLRLDRVARLVSDNAIGTQDVNEIEASEPVQFEQTMADMEHSREMVKHVSRWIAEDPSRFDTSLWLYLDGGGADDGLDIPE